MFIAERSGINGRALDWGSNGYLFEPRRWRSYCVVSFSKTLYPLLCSVLLPPMNNRPRHDWKNVDWDVNNQTKQSTCLLVNDGFKIR